MTDLPKLKRIIWRRRNGGDYVAYWVRSKKGARLGFPIKMQRLWRGDALTMSDVETISTAARGLDREMKDWIKNGPQGKPSRRTVERGYVYFAQCGDTIKIGFSMSVTGRIRSLQTSNGALVVLLGTIPGTRDREKAIHGMFRNARLAGEWFRATPELIDFVENITKSNVRKGVSNDSNVEGLSHCS